MVRRGRERAEVGGPAGSSTVIALAGATGSGKSSLFNAFAGLAVSEVGARRPTTSVPSAVVWGEVPDRLLDWLEVPRRHRTQRESALDAHDEDPLHGLVLLDLPDHDSTEVANRLQVDRLVGLVDLLVFVVDPQKYADDALHTGYLRPLVGHQELLLVVLNQVDRLDEASARACEADLRRLLDADGLDRVHVVRTSARTGAGVADLREIVAGAVAAKSASVRRTEADVEVAAQALARSVAATEPELDRLDGAEQLVDVLAVAAGVPTVLDAVHTQELRRGRRTTGWPPTRWVGRWRPDALARLHLGGPGARTGR
ncbi:MAG: putative ATP-binding membrane protein, partial [uncultured Quadrisphaera sp.]